MPPHPPLRPPPPTPLPPTYWRPPPPPLSPSRTSCPPPPSYRVPPPSPSPPTPLLPLSPLPPLLPLPPLPLSPPPPSSLRLPLAGDPPPARLPPCPPPPPSSSPPPPSPGAGVRPTATRIGQRDRWPRPHAHRHRRLDPLARSRPPRSPAKACISRATPGCWAAPRSTPRSIAATARRSSAAGRRRRRRLPLRRQAAAQHHPRRRLRRAASRCVRFLDEAAGARRTAGRGAGPLPPSFAFESRPVRAFFGLLAEMFGGAVVCEPRHASWFTPAADRALAAAAGRRAPPTRPACPRHSPGGWLGPDGDGRGAVLITAGTARPHVLVSLRPSGWSRATNEGWPKGADVWCIFDDTASGAALSNALELRDAMRGDDPDAFEARRGRARRARPPPGTRFGRRRGRRERGLDACHGEEGGGGPGPARSRDSEAWGDAVLAFGNRQVPLTNCDRAVLAGRRHQQGRLAAVLRRCRAGLLPRLLDRAMVMKRYPDGEGSSFS